MIDLLWPTMCISVKDTDCMAIQSVAGEMRWPHG